MSEQDQGEWWETLAVQAQEVAKTGRISEALALVREIPKATSSSGWAWQKTTALTMIAAKLLEEGAAAKAAQVLEEARVACEALHDRATWGEADCLTEIAALLLKLDARDEAVATWLKAAGLTRPHQWDMDSVKTLVRIARDLTQIGEIDRATEVARVIGDDATRDRTLWEIALRARGGAPSDEEALLEAEDPQRRPWCPGVFGSYFPPPTVYLGPGLQAKVFPPIFGEILYCVEDLRVNLTTLMIIAALDYQRVQAQTALLVLVRFS